MILTDGPKAVPFAPLPLEWLTPEMLDLIPASPAHLWMYLWSLVDHSGPGAGRLPKGKWYSHLEAAQRLRTNERTVRRWFAELERSGWMESFRARGGVRVWMRRVPPPGRPTGRPFAEANAAAQERTPESAASLGDPDPERTPMSVLGPARTAAPPEPPQMSAAADISVRENGHPCPFPMDPEGTRDSEGGGGPAAAVVGGGHDSTPPAAAAEPPPADRPPPVTPPASKGEGGERDYYAATDRVASQLQEYLGTTHPLDAGVRRTLAYELHRDSLALQQEIVLTAAATFKAEGFKYVSVPRYWQDRLTEARAKVEAGQRRRHAALWEPYDPDDVRYPAPTASERARSEARALLAKRAPQMLAQWDPVARRTIPVPVSLAPIGEHFTSVGQVLAGMPAPPRPPPAAGAERGAEGDAA